MKHSWRGGTTVVGLDNFDAFYGRAVKERNLARLRNAPAFTFREGDILAASSLGDLLTAETVVVHLAARPGVRPSLADPAGYARVNVEGTAAVLTAARDRGVTRIVFGSSSSVYGDDTPPPFREDAACVAPLSPYAATKRAGELLLGGLAPICGFRAAALRFFTVYGPRQRPDLAIHAFARKILAGETITLFGDGSQSRDYTYCDDIVAGVVAAMDWTGQRRGGPGAVQPGREPPGPAPRDGRRAVGGAGHPGEGSRWAPMQPGDVQHTYADLTRSSNDARVPSPGGVPRGTAALRRLAEGVRMRISSDHLIARARERFVLQDYYGAIHLLEDVVNSGRAFADAYHLLGLCYALVGQHERALEHFDAALEQNPRYFEAHVHRGIVLTELGRRAEAEEAFRQAASANPTTDAGFPWHVAAQLANQHAALGQAYAQAGAVQEAITEYQRSVELGPTFADLRYRLARLLLEAGRTLEARDELERVVKERPNFLDAKAALGLARYLSGDGSGAQEIWGDVLAQRPGSLAGRRLSFDDGAGRPVRLAGPGGDSSPWPASRARGRPREAG